MWRKTRAAPLAPRAAFADIFGADGPADADGHPDERLHHVRVVGVQSVDPGVSVAAAGSRWNRIGHWRDGGSHRGDAGRDVVRVRHVRLHQRRRWQEAHVCHLPHVCGGAHRRVRVDARSAGCCSCLDPSWPSSARATSAGSARSRRRFIPPSIRASAQGFTYNIGRIASAIAPFAVGSLAADPRLRRGIHHRRGRVRSRGGLLDRHSRRRAAGRSNN